MKLFFDATGKIIIPGMIDVHIHGGYDIDAMDANSDGLVTLGKEMLKEGVTTYFPTTMTQAPEAIEAALTAAKEAKEKRSAFRIYSFRRTLCFKETCRCTAT